jgi:hypothetical protein
MRNIDARANTKVISLDARRKLRATWDKPLTTEYASNKNTCKLYYFKEHKRQAASVKRRAAGYKLWK